MGYLDKLNRINEARSRDEQPLVDALRKHGFDAYLNPTTDWLQNKKRGDVLYRVNPVTEVGIECQGTRTNERFSYTANKVGPNGFQGQLVFLSCLDEGAETADQAVCVLIMRSDLEKFLTGVAGGDFHRSFLSKDGSYYVIHPLDLIEAHPGRICYGNSPEETIASWKNQEAA